MEEDTLADPEQASAASVPREASVPVDLARLARLAMLDLDPEVLEVHARDIEAMLVRIRTALAPFAAPLSEEGAFHVPAPAGVANALRIDRVRPEGISREAILATFPRHDGQRALGPRIHD